LIFGLGEFELYAIDAVHTIDEEDEDEDESYLVLSQHTRAQNDLVIIRTFMPYCTFATRGFSEMNVNKLRFMLKGRGMMRDMKTSISKTRRANTCCFHSQYSLLE
jgi:hypothetical protein